MAEGKNIFDPFFMICLSKEPNINYIKWKRSHLPKSKDVDLVVLNDIEKEN